MMASSENIWQKYTPELFFDETITTRGNPRVASRGLVRFFEGLMANEMNERVLAAKLTIRDMGISFNVRSQQTDNDRVNSSQCLLNCAQLSQRIPIWECADN